MGLDKSASVELSRMLGSVRCRLSSLCKTGSRKRDSAKSRSRPISPKTVCTVRSVSHSTSKPK